MRILSIDIGIKYLAFCLFNITTDEEYKIERWDIINLCEKDKKQCCEQNNKKKNCSRIPRYKKNDKYYCKIHAKKQDLKITPKELSPAALKKLRIYELKKLCNTLNISTNDKKIKKKAYLDCIQKHLGEHYLDIVVTPKARDMNIVTLGRNIQERFSGLFHSITLDHVIIENQIAHLASRMKMIQGMVMQYFIGQNITYIKEISATNKLKLFLPPNTKTTYKERKQLGIMKTTEILKSSNIFNCWLEHFTSHKKKDDLADAFLQGLWYLHFNQIIKLKTI